MRPGESFVEQPIRDLQTMLRVIADDDPKQPTVIPDGIYGPSPMNAVLAYEPALIRIEKAEPIEIIMDPGKVFRKGDISPYIYLLQSMLTQLSTDHPAITAPGHSGVLDDRTSESLAAFQRLADLPVTGELDKLSWRQLVRHFSLNAHHNSAAQTPNNE